MTEVPNEFFHTYYYYYNVRFLQIIGLWPYQSVISKIVCITMSFVIAESILIPQIFAAIKLTQVNTINILKCIPTMVIAIGCGIKMINSIYHTNNIKTLLLKMIKNWNLITGEEEIQILRSYSERGRQLTLSYAYSETSDKSIIPFEVDYLSLIDIKKYYYLILVHCYICVIAHVLIIVAVDTIFITFIQHSCAMYAILGYHLEHMADIENEKSDLCLDDKAYWRIINCIRQHNEIIDFVDRIESIYSTYFFFQLGYNMINISITGTQIVLYADVMFEFIRLTLLTLAQLFHLFFECWQAQQLIDHSSLIHESICRATWYRTTEKSKKLIKIMLINTLETSKLTAGKLLVLCFECFALVVNKSVSYFTILRTMQ
ncbi:odorant receptor 83a-like isoform X2 [Vespa velutina]|uniref:odorant receptor 83a-like isoform X2 n=1 Tax=Vespa velutina TaxID=202808 RepID=UPI001FB38FC7|nr:odorant receptor 83a-like isoform X2 [Vespa velutina]